jgi:hypothetical protein
LIVVFSQAAAHPTSRVAHSGTNLRPTRPGLGQPDYDVAWLAGDVLFVAGVKGRWTL